MDKLAVLIPAYNEEQTIEKVVKDVIVATTDIPGTVVYVYDNNSRDRTSELATAAGAVVRHEFAQGKGAVIRRMFREIDAEAYIMIDADDTYPVEAIPEMYSLSLIHISEPTRRTPISYAVFCLKKKKIKKKNKII